MWRVVYTRLDRQRADCLEIRFLKNKCVIVDSAMMTNDIDPMHNWAFVELADWEDENGVAAGRLVISGAHIHDFPSKFPEHYVRLYPQISNNDVHVPCDIIQK